MKRRNRSLPILAALLAIGADLPAANGHARDNPAGTIPMVDGDPVYEVLPSGAIPAITDPVYVTGEEAVQQMSTKSPTTRSAGLRSP